MSVVNLRPQPLDRDAFAPFGEVIDNSGHHFSINAGGIERFDSLALAETDTQGRVAISLAQCNRPVSLPLPVTVMERHPLGSQAFVPLGPWRMVIVVAPAGDPPSAKDLRAFRTEAGQGVNYRRGTWHMPMLGLAADQRWLIIDRAGDGDNCEEFLLTDEVVLHEH